MRGGKADRWLRRPPATLLLRTVLVPAILLIPPLAAAKAGSGACTDRPRVSLDESTASSHLIAKRDPEIPAGSPRLVRLEKVVLRLTVDRRGRICSVEPVLGHPELTQTAIKLVRTHWKYRPFLIDWKPATVQFPLTLWFAPSKSRTKKVAKSILTPPLRVSA